MECHAELPERRRRCGAALLVLVEAAGDRWLLPGAGERQGLGDTALWAAGALILGAAVLRPRDA